MMKKSMKLMLLRAALLGSLAMAGCGSSSAPAKSGSAGGQQQSKLMQTIK